MEEFAGRIEALEARIAPAVVNVSFVNGILTLTGDATDNEVTITAVDAGFALDGAGTTVFHQDGVAVDTGVVVFAKPLKSIVATFGDAADSLTLAGLKLAGDVTINGGGGDNTITVTESLLIKGGLKITGAGGTDEVNFARGAVSVGKDFTLDLGDGDNSVKATVTSFQVGKSLSYTGGSGKDDLSVGTAIFKVGGDFLATVKGGASSFSFGAQAFTVGKNLTYDASASGGGDTAGLISVASTYQVKGTTTIIGGAGVVGASMTATPTSVVTNGNLKIVAGTGTVQFGASSVFYGLVTVDGANSAGVNFSGFGKGLNFTGGNGVDKVQFYGMSGGSVIVDAGDGANEILVSSQLKAFKDVLITAGADEDKVQVSALASGAGRLDIQTGAGNDAVVVYAVKSEFGSLSIQTGTDEDTTALSLHDSAASGVLALKSGSGGKSAFDLNFQNSSVGSFDLNSEAETTVAFSPAVVSVFQPTSGFTVKGDLSIKTGDATDKVDFSKTTNVKVGKNLTINLGGGSNEFKATGMVNFTTKALTVVGGDDSTTFDLQSSGGTLGVVKVNNGPGALSMTLGGSVVPLAIASLDFTSTSSAVESDTLTLSRVVVAGKLNAKFGEGDSQFETTDSIFKNAVAIDTGAGNDEVWLDTLGSVVSYVPTVFTGPVSILLGADDDKLTIGSSDPYQIVTTKGTFTADGGTGTNTLNNGNQNVFAQTPVFTLL